jgi:hypothetical protein
VRALTVRVWQRYGQLRLYVSAGERDLGWYDPRSGRFLLGEPGLGIAFWTAARAECDRLCREGKLSEPVLPAEAATALAAQAHSNLPTPEFEHPATGPVSHLVPGPARVDTHWVVREPEWDDLALTEPGASAQARARELRRQRPLRTAVARILRRRSPARSFEVGARGERTVGRKLNRWATASGWHVLHAVPVGQKGADIDHVVIGPFGVVTVNTKTTRCAVWVGQHGMVIGSRKVDYLRKSRTEGQRARRLLARAAGWDVPVQPVIVFNGTRGFSMRRGGPADVAVLPSPRTLRRWLRRQPEALDPGQVEALFEIARHPATWIGQGA